MNTYDLFQGKDLEIAELIQQRRLQMLVHSCIYYEFNKNLISDEQWDMWAMELRTLQKDYPNISKKVMWFEEFKDWDASTGAFLPLRDSWVQTKAQQLIGKRSEPKTEQPKKKKVVKKRLF